MRTHMSHTCNTYLSTHMKQLLLEHTFSLRSKLIASRSYCTLLHTFVLYNFNMDIHFRGEYFEAFYEQRLLENFSVLYESFAKHVTKMGLLRVMSYNLNPIDPPYKHLKMGVSPCCELFSYCLLGGLISQTLSLDFLAPKTESRNVHKSNTGDLPPTPS